MATTPTANYNFGKPTVGGSVDAWGTELNTALDDIDTAIKTYGQDAAAAAAADAAAAQATADAALPKAGGVMTGRTDEHSGTVVFEDHVGVVGAETLDMANANYHRVALTGNPTFTFDNVPGVSGSIDVLIVDITGGSGKTITWPASVTEWYDGGAQPTPNSHDVYVFISIDGGTNWQGAIMMEDLQ